MLYFAASMTRRMKKIAFFFILFPFCLSAQINESDTLKLQAKLSVTGFLQGGNVEAIVCRVKQDLSYQPFRKWVFKTNNSYVYQEFGQKKEDEDFLSLNFLYFNPERRFYPQILGILASNFRREISSRTITGFGVTYQILKGKENWLKASLSSEYEHTEFDTEAFNISDYNGTSQINTFRGTIWVNGQYQLFDKHLIFSHESYFQPSLEQGDNYRWQADLSLEVPISKYFRFKTNYLHTFESIVAEEQRVEDRVLTFGFTVKTY